MILGTLQPELKELKVHNMDNNIIQITFTMLNVAEFVTFLPDIEATTVNT